MIKSGILKSKSKYDSKSNFENFLVWGYHCKLYRDDRKALELDRETHLIPAPYEEKDLISRYDVRATLSEIATYEASSNSYMNRLDGLSASEQQAEALAEEERYYSLFRNEVEEEIYKEEEMKRQATASGYNQISFNYDESAKEKEIGPKESSDVQENNNDNEDNEDDLPFTPSEELKLPSEIECPTTVKINQIIEKTAKFIASQGLQMEILLKTKQASNPQFNFLNHNGQYNAYYKHILSLMKNNTYPWQILHTDKSNENSNDGNENSNSNDAIEKIERAAIVIPKIQYKPSADCHYTQLISKITKAPISELERKQEEEQKKAQNNNADVPKISSGLLGLSNYNSDSDSENNDDEDDGSNGGNYCGEIPPSEIQIVIDKTATYVAKNGTDFEQKLICKQDARFEFLHEDNKYHLYYKMKVKSYLPTAQQTTTTTSSNNNHNTNINLTLTTSMNSVEIKKVEIILPKVPPAPVSFSIKAKEERPTLKVTTKMGSSDDEKNCDEIVPEAPSPPRISTVEEELERQVDIINAEREEKLAKDRLSDKLLNAAREKLGMLPKEKMLQIERKKRAMMFINQIKGSNGNSSNCGSKKEDDVINLVQCGEESNDSVKSSSSIKSSSNATNNKREYEGSRSRSRKKSSSSRSRTGSSSSSQSRSSSRSSDSSPKRKRSKKHKSRKKKHRRSSRNRSRSPSSERYKYSKRR